MTEKTKDEQDALVRSLLRSMRDEVATFHSLTKRPARPILAYSETPDHGREF